MFRRTAITVLSVVLATSGLTVAGTAAATTATAAAKPGTAAQPADETANKITTKHWNGISGLLHGRWSGLLPGLGGGLRLSPIGSLPTREYTDPFGDGSPVNYQYGSWTSPVIETGYPIDESVSSWNASTPTGTWVETTFRGRLADGTWTKWYVMGRWASGDDFAAGDIHRTSLDDQGDANANIWTDTFSAKTGHEPVAYQTRVTLLRPVGSHSSPVLDGITTMTNEYLPTVTSPTTSAFTLGRQVELNVPPYAQNIHAGEYPEFGGGGEVWCSPTSSTMVLYYWAQKHRAQRVPAAELAGIVAPNGDPQVDYGAINTWDYTYEGSGNWPFNTAYTHRFGLTSFVTRLRSLAEAEKFIAAGIPVITSLSWSLSEMPEAGYSTNGHLMVIVGFTAAGDPILNDPASNSNANVRSIYTRKNFEKVWQKATDGIVYINVPKGMHLPANIPGVTKNW
ncbi:C39 family peptidase [Nakamurella lactea]|uniref:C39 family peptidase n=1 Tax=Nakamurella lactea TaxID=459515 RepID=UPI00040AB9D0|nr:C39 family peptidase [Nakamurella lactea]